ncbi:MAG: helix-turn-helix domain-containing protein [Acidimicrobiales bacterium]
MRGVAGRVGHHEPIWTLLDTHEHEWTRMARPKKPRANPETDAFVGIIGLTANQIVAYNLTQARLWRNLTQEQSAEAIEPFLGVRWSKASVSQAERSVDGNFVRNFSADEIAAFAQAFELPITWFFMPPPPQVAAGNVVLVNRDGTNPRSLAGLVDLVFGTEEAQAILTMRLDAWLEHNPTMSLTEAQSRITDLVKHRIEALLRDKFRDLSQWRTELEAIAGHLEILEADAKRGVAAEAGIDVRELRGTPAPEGPAGADASDEAAEVGDAETRSGGADGRRRRRDP